MNKDTDTDKAEQTQTQILVPYALRYVHIIVRIILYSIILPFNLFLTYVLYKMKQNVKHLCTWGAFFLFLFVFFVLNDGLFIASVEMIILYRRLNRNYYKRQLGIQEKIKEEVEEQEKIQRPVLFFFFILCFSGFVFINILMYGQLAYYSSQPKSFGTRIHKTNLNVIFPS